MIPTTQRLATRLDDRYRWFRNEWFFKWHFIGHDGPVTIDTFDGQSAHYGGIAFGGSARDIYWEAIVRGVRKEIVEQFAWVDGEVRNYNPATAIRAIDECAGQITSFARRIRRNAIEKDRILRGDGINFPAENDAGRWDGTSDADIQKQATSLKEALPEAGQSVSHPTAIVALSRRKRALALWNDNQWWLGPIGLVIALAGLLPLLFGCTTR